MERRKLPLLFSVATPVLAQYWDPDPISVPHILAIFEFSVSNAKRTAHVSSAYQRSVMEWQEYDTTC